MSLVPTSNIVETVPMEVWHHIFSYLSPKDLLRSAQVNKVWNIAAHHFLSQLEDPREDRCPVYTRTELIEKVRKLAQTAPFNEAFSVHIQTFRRKGDSSLSLGLYTKMRALSPRYPETLGLGFWAMLDEVAPAAVAERKRHENTFVHRGERFPNRIFEVLRLESFQGCEEVQKTISKIVRQREWEWIDSFLEKSKPSIAQYNSLQVLIKLLFLSLILYIGRSRLEQDPNRDG